MKKFITTDPKSFVFFMNQHKPSYVACSKDAGDVEDGFNRRHCVVDWFRAWFFFQDNANEQCLCELRLRGMPLYSFDSKADVIAGLRDLKVSEEDIAKLKTMSVKKILAVSMMDKSDDENEVSSKEETQRTRWEFQVGLRQVKVIPDLESRTQLKAKVEINYSYEVDWLYGEVKIGLPEGTPLAENCTLELVSTNN